MKRLLILVVACALAPVASAELYKYVDKNGKTVYTDQPPPDAQAKQIHAPPPAPAAPAKTFTARDKEQQKAREETRDKEKKAERSAQDAKLAAERCAAAQTNLQTYTEGGRILGYNDKGERGYLTDEQIAAERVKAQRQVEEACRKP